MSSVCAASATNVVTYQLVPSVNISIESPTVVADASGGSLTNYLNVVTPDGKIHTSGAITFA